MHNFIKDSRLQLGSSGFICLAYMAVQHVCYAAGVSVSACQKSGHPTLYHLNLACLVSFVRVPDGTAVVEV